MSKLCSCCGAISRCGLPDCSCFCSGFISCAYAISIWGMSGVRIIHEIPMAALSDLMIILVRHNSHWRFSMRGVYENPADSGIWWIHYYADGKRHREKVGRKSDAIKLYQSRKADAAAGRKLPELRNSKVLVLSELIDDVLEFTAHHKDQ